MFSQRQILGSIGSLGIMLGIASGVRANQTSTHPAKSTAQFRNIEQPLSLKIGVTAGGLTLIGLELWWFLFSKHPAKTQYGSVKPGDPP
jgi:plastocyanin domain-containing protein